MTRARSIAGGIADAFEQEALAQRSKGFPMARYRGDILAYVHERLKVKVLFPHQEEILLALQAGIEGRASDRIAVRSGQKCGKSATAVYAALWFYECFPDARVFLCAAIIEQTKNVLWKELSAVVRRAREGDDSIIPGKLAASPSGGLRSLDGTREIVGVSGREIESLAGLSGQMFTIIDEASHLPEAKAQAFAGNTMGGGAMLWISNPTRNEGPFYEAFHAHKDHWQIFNIDAEDVAKWQADQGIRIPFTATRDKIEQFRELFGEDSIFWIVRVKGDWVRNETGRAIPMFRIDEAKARWKDAPEEGPLSIGWDPAGPGEDGDYHGWAVVRGMKCLAIFRKRGISDEEALAFTYSLLDVHQKEGEDSQIVVDAEGVGDKFYQRMTGESEERRIRGRGKNQFTCVRVKSSSKAVREPRRLERVRDELVWELSQWMIEGAIPSDDRLEGELYAPQWTTVPHVIFGSVLRSTQKPVLRDLLNRSPDSFDALALAVRRPRVIHETASLPQRANALATYAQPYAQGRSEGGDRGRPLGEAYGVFRRR